MHRTTGFWSICHVFKGRKLAASTCVKKRGEMAWFFVHFKVGYSGSCSFVIHDNVINHGRVAVESPIGLRSPGGSSNRMSLPSLKELSVSPQSLSIKCSGSERFFLQSILFGLVLTFKHTLWFEANLESKIIKCYLFNIVLLVIFIDAHYSR